MTSTVSAEKLRRLEVRGGNLEFFYLTDTEGLAEGPAGTGKTRAICELLNLIALKYPGSKQLMCRKQHTALTDAALATFREQVLEPSDAEFFGGSKQEPPAFRYYNGSSIVVRGLDKIGKTQSAEYDNVYVNEATELVEADWEMLLRALRHGVTPHQRLMGDCNPGSERSWLLRRCTRGQTHRVKTTVRDNPAYWNLSLNCLTPAGEAYMRTLSGLTGTRYQRLVLGEWVGMENAVYPQAEPDKHLIPCPEGLYWTGRGAIGVDYGIVHLSAVVLIMEDTYGRWWVRECWAKTGGDPEEIEDACRSMRVRFKIKNGRTGPEPALEVLAKRLSMQRAKMGAGARKGRIAAVTRLFDANALFFDKTGDGVAELFEEILDYRWLVKDEVVNEDAVMKEGEDRVAALEYAVEESQEARSPTAAMSYA